MPFIPYRPRTTRMNPPHANITRAGVLSLNAAAWEEILKKQPYVELFFDPDSRMIGLKPSQEDSKMSLKFWSPPNKALATLPIPGVLKHFGIRLGRILSLDVTEGPNRLILIGPIPEDAMVVRNDREGEDTE